MQTSTARPASLAGLELGLILPNYRPGASAEGMAAAVETCRRLGWASVWTTDHLLPDRTAPSDDYAEIFEALATLAWVGGMDRELRLGTSVIVVPMRQAVVLAKEIASVDALTSGRLTIGTGIGWSETEFVNVGAADRYHVRGAYLEEAIAVWRHLWSGSTEPFHGRFIHFDDFRFGPLPAQGAALPILIGGRAPEALRRAGRVADGFHSSSASPETFAERAAVVREAAAAASRPEPAFSARAQVRFGPRPEHFYALAGTPDEMRADLEAFRDAGATQVMLDFVETDPEVHTGLFERFARDVLGD